MSRYKPNPIEIEGSCARIGLLDMTGVVQAWAIVDLEDLDRVRTRKWSLAVF